MATAGITGLTLTRVLEADRPIPAAVAQDIEVPLTGRTAASLTLEVVRGGHLVTSTSRTRMRSWRNEGKISLA